MMNTQHQRKWATAITISSFFMVGITGLLIFFELVFAGVRALHEWMSLVFVFGASAHIIVNLSMFKRYFSNARSILAAVTVLGVLVFVSAYKDIYVAEKSYELLLHTSFQQLLDLQGLQFSQVESLLSEHEILVDSTQLSVLEVATLNGIDGHEVLETVFSWEGR